MSPEAALEAAILLQSRTSLRQALFAVGQVRDLLSSLVPTNIIDQLDHAIVALSCAELSIKNEDLVRAFNTTKKESG